MDGLLGLLFLSLAHQRLNRQGVTAEPLLKHDGKLNGGSSTKTFNLNPSVKG